MADRRRNNGPPGGSKPLLYSCMIKSAPNKPTRPTRTRKPDELRKIYLKTGITPPASGSAYLELESPHHSPTFLLPSSSALKLSVAVHGPRPLARSAAYSPHLALSCYVKFTPFATRHRRGYLRDPTEKDLSTQLETALRGVIIGERYPKTGVDVCVTILEGEEDRWWAEEPLGGAASVGGWGLFGVLAGCVTAASAALVDAGIDCIDLVSGGVAALVARPLGNGDDDGKRDDGVGGEVVLDPNPTEHENIVAACVVAYVASKDEVTLLWLRGGSSSETSEKLMDGAVSAALASRGVLEEALKETALLKFSEED
ncbi:exoribonuclease family protein [Microthyrium microscopicum]|uniref:Exoribonuclease family protein n=1 Tax=Microthyrium microscopicum TaxID=703497 RepID=A0A6A6UMK8_9PEZI|nr:exoribonuclease family protein [Microthyrium microscopicum]